MLFWTKPCTTTCTIYRLGAEIPILTQELRSVTNNKEEKLYNIDYYKLYLFLSTPFLICSDSFLQKTWVSYVYDNNTSLVMIRMTRWDLDSEDVYVEMRSNLIANTDAIADQVKERKDQGNPKYNVFINKAVKILV